VKDDREGLAEGDSFASGGKIERLPIRVNRISRSATQGTNAPRSETGNC
jgi:hypothetical protein